MPKFWPFTPLLDFSSSLEWSTDVLGTTLGEQRISRRAHPRQFFNYSFKISPDKLSAFHRFLRQNPAGQWLVPDWQHEVRFTQVSSLDDTLSLDTNIYDFRVGDSAVIYLNSDSYVIKNVVTYGSGEIVFDSPVGSDFENVSVIPLRRCFFVGSVKIKRQHSDVSTDVNCVFQSYDNLNFQTGSYLEYLGIPVLDSPSVLGDLSENMGQPVQVLDAGFGPVEVAVARKVYGVSKKVSFIDLALGNNRSAFINRVSFFHALRGKLKSFWVPTWASDFSIVSPVSAGSNSVTVKPVMDLSEYVGLDVAIDCNGLICRKITSAVVSGQNHRLYMSPIPVDVDACDIHLLHKYRLDSDKITFAHSDGYIVRTSAPIVEVSE